MLVRSSPSGYSDVTSGNIFYYCPLPHAVFVYCHGSSTSECGVAVLLPRVLPNNVRVTESYNDGRGRLLLCDVDFSNILFKMFAVYAPTQSHVKQQAKFLETLREMVEEFVSLDCDRIIMCGDFNIQLTELDADKQKFRPSAAAKRLNNLLKKYKLVDVWRNKFPTVRRYSWRRLVPLQQSRKDYVFASKGLLTNHVVKAVGIAPGILSDHSMVYFEMQMVAHKKGPGLWRFNNTFLEDEQFTDWVRAEIDTARNDRGVYANVGDAGLLLEMLTSEIRAHSITIGKQKARLRREEEQKSIAALNECESEMCTNPLDDNIVRYQNLKKRIDEIQEEKGKKAMIWSGVRWMEHGETPSKYFLNMCSNKATKSQINALHISEEEVITDQREILAHCSSYYEDIYKSRRESRVENRNERKRI